jgi:hypothetical protein
VYLALELVIQSLEEGLAGNPACHSVTSCPRDQLQQVEWDTRPIVLTLLILLPHGRMVAKMKNWWEAWLEESLRIWCE